MYHENELILWRKTKCKKSVFTHCFVFATENHLNQTKHSKVSQCCRWLMWWICGFSDILNQRGFFLGQENGFYLLSSIFWSLDHCIFAGNCMLSSAFCFFFLNLNGWKALVLLKIQKSGSDRCASYNYQSMFSDEFNLNVQFDWMRLTAIEIVYRAIFVHEQIACTHGRFFNFKIDCFVTHAHNEISKSSYLRKDYSVAIFSICIFAAAFVIIFLNVISVERSFFPLLLINRFPWSKSFYLVELSNYINKKKTPDNELDQEMSARDFA